MKETAKQTTDFITLRDLVELFIGHIYWFVTSLAICLVIAIAYIIYTPPVFTHEATVLVGNRDNAGNKGGGGSDAFGAQGNLSSLFNTNSDAKSELHIFMSPTLMQQVVRNLRLDYDYSTKYKHVRWVSLYDQSPVNVMLGNAKDETSVSFSITPVDNDNVRISNLNVDGTDIDFDKTIPLSRMVSIPQVRLFISPSQSYLRSIGQTIHFIKSPMAQVVGRYSGGLTATLSEDESPLIILDFKDTNHDRANDVLNMLIRVYNESWIRDKNQITVSTSAFINERLKVIESELSNVDSNISSYKSKRMLPDVSAVSNLYLTQSSAARTQGVALQNQLSVATYLFSYMKNKKMRDQLLPANVGIDNQSINGQIEQYNTQMLERNRLKSNSSEENPLVAEQTHSLQMMRQNVLRSIQDYISSIEIQMRGIGAEEQSNNAKISANPNEAKYLLSEERKQKVKEELYVFLLQQREQNEINQTFTAYNTKVVNEPAIGGAPPTPRKSVVLLIALIAGLFIPAIILWLLNNLDTAVRSRDDIKKLSMPYLGEIPQLMEQKEKALKRALSRYINHKQHHQHHGPVMRIVVEEKNRNAINESFRNIRTNIDFMKPKTDGGVIIMNNSMSSGSGKTFILMNLAISMGIKGSKVLVIDSDLRKATLSRYVHSPHKGITNYIIENVKDIHDVIISHKMHQNVDVLPVGTIPPNPAELLINPRFGQLLTAMRSEYDYIFIDCPPAEIVTDSSIIAKWCDVTIFIIRAGLLDKRSLPDVESLYQEGTYHNMCLLLNGVDYSGGGRYGYHRYGYGKYGYGKYGYHHYGYGKYDYNDGDYYTDDNNEKK